MIGACINAFKNTTANTAVQSLSFKPLRRSASSVINPFSLPSLFRWGDAREGGREGREQDRNTPHPGLSPSSSREHFVNNEQNATASVSVLKYPGRFCWLCGLCLAHMQPSCCSIFAARFSGYATVGFGTGARLLPAPLGRAAASPRQKQSLGLMGLGGSRRWGQTLMRDWVLCMQL